MASYSTAYELAHRAEERCESACSSGQGSPDSVERMERKDWGVQQCELLFPSGDVWCDGDFELEEMERALLLCVPLGA